MKNHRLRRLKPQIAQIIILATCYSLLATLTGCDAFVRKFTRKPKGKASKEEFVLAPQEYKTLQVSSEELYRQYFLFWKSWQDELVNSLTSGANYKKQIYCVNEAIKNLGQMKALLHEAKQKELGVYLNQMDGLKSALTEDLYGNNLSVNRLAAERIKMGIQRHFSYKKIKDSLS